MKQANLYTMKDEKLDNWDGSKYKLPRILVTGGCGYLGSVLTQMLLDKSYKVRVIDNLRYFQNTPLNFINNEHFEFIKGDISNPADISFAMEDINTVIHLAAIVGEPECDKKKTRAWHINYEATKNITDIAKERGIQLIFTSTCSVYGIAERIVNELSIVNPLGVYARSKAESESYIRSTFDRHIILRLATMYGASPRMRYDLLVNQFSRDAWLEEKLDIYYGTTHRPYVHVWDVAHAICYFLQDFGRCVEQTYNIGWNDENYTKFEIAEKIKKTYPELVVNECGTDSDVRDYSVDFSKMKTISLPRQFRVDDGIRQVLKIMDWGL